MTFAPKFVDLVRNYTTTAGTDDFVLGPAVNGFASFADVCAAGDTFYYSATGVEYPAQYEVGRGTFNADGTIGRDPVSGTKTDFSIGTKSIALIAAAEWFQEAHALVGNASALGQSLVSAATPADARALLELSGGFNVKWFGAKGDSDADGASGTDDTAAIQAALDHVHSIGGGTIFFPEGVYKLTSYLTHYPYVRLRGAGRRASKLLGTHAGGGGSTPAESLRNGSILYNAQPINTTSAGNFDISDLWFHNSNPANQGAGFYQQSGDSITVRNCEFTGSKWGIVLDQSEDVTIDTCELSSYVDGGAGLWIVNGPDLDPAATQQFTNIVNVRNCHVNVLMGSYGIVDDGGYVHNISGCDFNGGIHAIRAAGVVGLRLDGNYHESQSSEIIHLDHYALSGTNVGGSFVSITGGQFSANVGQAAIKGYNNPGALEVIGGSYNGATTPLQGTALFSSVTIASPGLAGYPMVPFCDGVAVFAHADLGYLRAAADGKVGVPNVSGTTGGITLTPGASAGYVETFNSVGQRQGRAMFLNGTALQFDAQGAATSFQFLDPVSCTSSITSSGGGVGYATGAGGAATQATSKSNAVTLNTLTGQITTTADSMAANTITVFQVNNSNVAATDVVIVNIGSGPASASAYRASVTVVQNGLFKIMLENRSAGALAEALTLNFAVIKAVTA